MKALVFGINGFLAGHMAKQLKSEGYYVIGVAHSQNKSFGYKSCDDLFVGDVRDVLFVDTVFEKVGHIDEVYQFAARMGGATHVNTKTYDADIMSDSVLMNVNIIKACVKFNARMMFFPSSACVYGQKHDIATCNEDDAYPAYPENGYGWEKIFTEQMLLSFRAQYGIQVRIARLHSIVGEFSRWCDGKEKAHSALARKVALVEENGEIEVIGDGSQVRTFLYVKDCIEGIRKLVQSECEEIINIGSDKPVTISKYVELLQHISGKRFKIKYIENHAAVGVKERYCNVDKARECIGWTPTTSLEDATRCTYEWICSEIKNGKLQTTSK